MIWALHGFLGQGQDWEFLRPPLSALNLELQAPNLLRQHPRGQSLNDWARQFTAQVSQLDSQPILLGYSMGARLALHALLQSSDLFSAAILVAPHLGFSQNEAWRRQQNDELWAERFERDAFEALVRDWNDLDVFKSSMACPPGPPRQRLERDFSRPALAHALRAWSTGRQEPLLAHLHRLKMPVLWVCGEHDQKFIPQMQQAQTQISSLQTWLCPNAGHRAPWDNPVAFQARIVSFLSELFEGRRPL